MCPHLSFFINNLAPLQATMQQHSPHSLLISPLYSLGGYVEAKGVLLLRQEVGVTE